MSDYRGGPGSRGYRAASVLTSPPALLWRNAKLKMREGAFGAARVPVSVTLPKTKVTDIRASPGAAPKWEAEDRRAPPTARLYKSLKGRKSQ